MTGALVRLPLPWWRAARSRPKTVWGLTSSMCNTSVRGDRVAMVVVGLVVVVVLVLTVCTWDGIPVLRTYH